MKGQRGRGHIRGSLAFNLSSGYRAALGHPERKALEGSL